MLLFILACQSQTPPDQPRTHTAKPIQTQTQTQDTTSIPAVPQGGQNPSVPPSKDTSFSVYFFDGDQNLKAVSRTGPSKDFVQGAIDTLYEGPTSQEKESGLKLLTCQSTGAQVLSIEKGLARVQLKGGCGGCSGMGIYETLVHTLKQFPQVQYVHVLDPSGKTQALSNHSHARPSCLEP